MRGQKVDHFWPLDTNFCHLTTNISKKGKLQRTTAPSSSYNKDLLCRCRFHHFIFEKTIQFDVVAVACSPEETAASSLVEGCHVSLMTWPLTRFSLVSVLSDCYQSTDPTQYLPVLDVSQCVLSAHGEWKHLMHGHKIFCIREILDGSRVRHHPWWSHVAWWCCSRQLINSDVFSRRTV